MSNNIQRDRKFDFSGAIQDATSWIMKKANELKSGFNLRFDYEIGEFRRRLGYVKAGSAPVAFATNKTPHGGFLAWFTTGSVRMIAVNNSGDTATILRTQNSSIGTWTDLAGTPSIPPNSEIFFMYFNDEVFVTGYERSSGTPITPFNIDKTLNVSLIRNILNMPPCYYLVQYAGNLYAANVVVGGVRYPNRAYQSSGPLGAVTFVKGAQSGILTGLPVDSVRYLKPGTVIDLYAAGTETELYDSITITAVDKNLGTISFVPYALTFATSNVFPAEDTVELSDASHFPTGTPVQLIGASLPSPLVAGSTYYTIRPSTAETAGYAGSVTAGADWTDTTGALPASGSTYVNGAPDGVTAVNGNEGPGGGGHTPTQLVSAGHGLAVPAGATITGIKLDAWVYGDTGSSDTAILVGKPTKLSTSTPNFGQVWPNPLGKLTWGSTTALWGRTDWTPADMNDPTFGASIAAFASHATGTIKVDSVLVTVYYTSANDIQLATTLANAQGGTPIDITTQGSGAMGINLVYSLSDNDEIWLHGRKATTTVLWNTDFPNLQDADYLGLMPGIASDYSITAIIASSNRLFLFSRSSTSRWDGQQLVTVNATVGCVSQRTAQNLEDDWLIWLDKNGNIWARKDLTTQHQKISKPIYKLWVKKFPQSTLKDANAVVIDSRYKLYLGQLSGENIRVVYDFDANAWTVEKLTNQALYQFVDDFSGGDLPYFVGETDYVYQDETGNDDDGTVIPMQAEIGSDLLGTEQRKAWYGVLIFTKDAAGLTVQAQIDDSDKWVTVGEIRRNVQWIKFKEDGIMHPEPGTYINLRLSGSVNGDSPSCKGIVTYFTTMEDNPGGPGR